MCRRRDDRGYGGDAPHVVHSTLLGDIDSDRLTIVDPVQADYGGQDDVVIATLTPRVFERALTTFFGGDGFDAPTSIAIDADGNIYVVGFTTHSTTFPTPAADYCTVSSSVAERSRFWSSLPSKVSW